MHLDQMSVSEADGSRVAATLNARFTGIDIVMRDPTVPLRESGGVILEVNGTPNLYYHYNKQDGATPVAVPLLRKLLFAEALHHPAGDAEARESVAVGAGR